MNLESYTLALGKILVGFHSLEISLRHFFQGYEATLNPPSPVVPPKPLRVGQMVPKATYSAYDSLNGLLKSFNAVVKENHANLALSPALIELRDALAHGRVWSETLQPPLQLLKFSKPLPNSVGISVLQADVIDEAWLQAQMLMLERESAKVFKTGKLMHPKRWA